MMEENFSQENLSKASLAKMVSVGHSTAREAEKAAIWCFQSLLWEIDFALMEEV